MDKPENPQAFPVPLAVGPSGDAYPGYDGMSLRDYFAGQALAGLCANNTLLLGIKETAGADNTRGATATIAFSLADAMLLVRAGGTR